MYLWRKRADGSWLAAHENALRSLAGDGLAVIERPNRMRLQIEVASPSRRALEKLMKRFGGRIEKLPRNWLERFLRRKTIPVKVGSKSLIIPASAAFGTGEHATTAMCLRLLERVMRPSETQARSPELVVDVGTGSGVLALAARLLGAKRVIGIDYDPVAISTAKQNARRNKIDNVQFRAGDVRRWKFPRRIAVLTANLSSELLIEILPRLRRSGWLILSGILREQQREVIHALKRNKVNIDVRRRGKWIAILVSSLNLSSARRRPARLRPAP
ncbi:MAG: 50S ribosomal protein L11 methyltransferase [Chthoniobacterales bacterium]